MGRASSSFFVSAARESWSLCNSPSLRAPIARKPFPPVHHSYSHSLLFNLLRGHSRVCTTAAQEPSPREASNGPALLVDTLALVHSLETKGFDANQAVAISEVLTDLLKNECLENAAESFVSRSDMETSGITYEAALSKLREDVQTSQEPRISSIHREVEKLRTEIDKLMSEMRLQMDKVAAGQRLDLNLERGHITKELEKQSAETSNLASKLDTEITALKTQLADSKYEVIKNCIGTIVSVYALGLALLQIFK